jgi:lipid A 3-O-deacylase
MKIRSFFVFLLIVFSGSGAHALDGISLGLGKSRDSINISRLGFQRQFGASWLKSKIGHLSGYHEFSLGHWEYESESVTQIAYSPVFFFQFAGPGKSVLAYLEGGIGVGYLSEKTIKDRDLSSHFQFEDRIGAGVKIGGQHEHDLNFRYMHYSNAGIKQPNEGIDIFIFSYTYHF